MSRRKSTKTCQTPNSLASNLVLTEGKCQWSVPTPPPSIPKDRTDPCDTTCQVPHREFRRTRIPNHQARPTWIRYTPTRLRFDPFHEQRIGRDTKSRLFGSRSSPVQGSASSLCPLGTLRTTSSTTFLPLGWHWTAEIAGFSIKWSCIRGNFRVV